MSWFAPPQQTDPRTNEKQKHRQRLRHDHRAHRRPVRQVQIERRAIHVHLRPRQPFAAVRRGKRPAIGRSDRHQKIIGGAGRAGEGQIEVERPRSGLTDRERNDRLIGVVARRVGDDVAVDAEAVWLRGSRPVVGEVAQEKCHLILARPKRRGVDRHVIGDARRC